MQRFSLGRPVYVFILNIPKQFHLASCFAFLVHLSVASLVPGRKEKEVGRGNPGSWQTWVDKSQASTGIDTPRLINATSQIESRVGGSQKLEVSVTKRVASHSSGAGLSASSVPGWSLRTAKKRDDVMKRDDVRATLFTQLQALPISPQQGSRKTA